MKRKRKDRLEREAGGGAAGAVTGALVGAVAGPVGAAAGAVLGGAAGALAGFAADSGEVAEAAKDGKLDAEIGVSGGELGAPNLKHPPAKIGAYSGSSTGTSSGDGEEPADGPFQRDP